MIKSIGCLKDDNRLTIIERYRIFVGRKDRKDIPGIQEPPSWQLKRLQLEKDLLSGNLGVQGRLPPLKEMQARYGVCFETMKKIMRTLVADGVVLRNGKGYSLPGIPKSTHTQKIIFITCTGHFLQRSALNQEHNRIVNLFESECIRRGLEFEVIEIDFYDPLSPHRRALEAGRSDRVLGFLLDIWWYPTQTYQRAYLDTLAQLTLLKKPVAILDEIGSFALPLPLSRNAALQVFSIEKRRAGECVGHLLQGHGHRSVALFSLSSEAQWSQERIAGVTALFDQPGRGKSAHIFSGTPGEGFSHLVSATGLSDSGVKKLIALGRTRSQAFDLETQWRRFKQNPERSMIETEPAYATLKANLARLGRLFQVGFTDDFLTQACDGILQETTTQLVRLRSRPLFEQALDQPEITAWVCDSDIIALEALSFLGARTIRVPDDLSVVGFDNLPVVSLEQGLTTFDFNATGFVHRMLNFVIRPPKVRGAFRHETIEVEGIIVERGTTGRARQKE